MTLPLVLALAGVPAVIGLAALWVRRGFLVTTVTGSSMEPALGPGDRLLVRRTRQVRTGQIVVFTYTGPPGDDDPGDRSRSLLIKRVVAGPGGRVPREWEHPDVHHLAGTVVPPASRVVLGDNRATSWDSRHYGLVRDDRLVGVVLRRLPGPRGPEADTAREDRPHASLG